MASRVSPNPKCWDLRTPYSPSHSHWKNLVIGHGFFNALPGRLVYRSPFSRSSNLRVKRGKHSCSAHFDDFHIEERMNLVKGNVGNTNSRNSQLKNVSDRGSSEKFCTMKPELLEPSFLGIQPEPPTWPERDEILRLSFERKVNSVEIPLSIRMIKKKLQLQEGVNEACELSYSSVKKTFSTMMLIIHELQNHALQTRESLCCEDLQSVIDKLRGEMDDSFVWLFQQVFYKTPTLVVDLMVLLANFSVFNMNNNNTLRASSIITKGLSFTNNESKQQHLQVDVEVDQDEYVKEELTEEEKVLWNSMLEEALTLQKELRNELLDHETKQQFVAPVSVELEGDQYEEYVKTDLYYKMHLLRTPQNSLLLSNYAQFLFLVLHDIDGAEEYYKRSVLVESPEAEAFSRYADFLWQVRKDVWAAELRYLQAMEADPGNTYCLSKYASFIWNTGGTDNASFPIEELDNLQL